MNDERIPVNDGGGLFDAVGLIETLIIDCNEIPRLLIGGHGVAFCTKIVEMVQKLSNLKTGVAHDIADRDEQIKELQAQIERGG